VKILRLDLRAFGPFTATALDLADGREGLHLIFGPNEAGKSSALRALRQMLFGIDERTGDRFLHDYDKLRVGGTLRGEDGSEISFLRRKGRRKVLRDAEDAADLDDAALDRFLGGIDERQYQTLFSIDHATLVAGGREIVKGEGEVGELVFGAGTDLRALRALQKRLKADYDGLFRPRGEVYPINRALAELEQARRDVEAASIRSGDWNAHRARLEEARRERDRLDAERAELRRRLARLERIRQALPDVARHRELVEAIEALAGAPRLPEDFGDRRRALQEAHREAIRAGEAASVELRTLDEELTNLPQPGAILDESAAIEGLGQRWTVRLQDAAEIGRLRVEAESQAAIARGLLLELGRDEATVDEAALHLPAARRQRIDRLMAEQQAIDLECKGLHRTIESLSSEAATHAEALESLVAPRDAEPLRRTLKRMAREGNLARDLEEAQDALRKELRLAEASRKRLAPWSPTWGEVESQAVPSAEVVERFRDEFDRDARTCEQLRADLAEDASALAEIQAELAKRRQGADVPSEPELRAARARRDLGWRLIKADWKGTAPDADPEALRAFAGFGGGDLAANFERSLAEADLLADRLRLEADRIGEVARLEAERWQLVERSETRRAALREAEAARSERLARWGALWAPLGLVPGTPKEMQAWLALHEKLVERVEAVREAEASATRAAERVRAAQVELNGLLAELGEPASAPGESLGALLDRAQATLERIDAARIRRAALDGQLRDAEARLASAKAEEAEALRRRSDWRSAWGEAMRSIGLDADADREEVAALLDRNARLAAALAAARIARERVARLEAESDALDRDAKETARRLAPDLADPSSAEILLALRRRLDASRDARSRRETLAAQRDRQAEILRSAREQARVADDGLSVLVREAGCASADELPAAEARAEARRRAEAERLAVEGRLRHLSGGATLDAFLADARSVDADALPVEIERLEAGIAGRTRACEAHAETIGREQEILGAMEETAREARANEAAGRVQGLLAEIESRASDYVRKRLASAVLREAIERYRERSQGPVLRRAGTYFARLTCGSFDGLRTELDDDGRPHLVGARPGGATLAVQGMSEGTCDALYLALKLGSLDHYLDHHAGMPLVLDDILVNLDDDRAREALKLLAEVASRTQVLFFTHHRHLVELAEMALPPDVLFTHELRGEGEPARAATA
jgi:uncharacterized protein YhaN